MTVVFRDDVRIVVPWNDLLRERCDLHTFVCDATRTVPSPFKILSRRSSMWRSPTFSISDTWVPRSGGERRHPIPPRCHRWLLRGRTCRDDMRPRISNRLAGLSKTVRRSTAIPVQSQHYMPHTEASAVRLRSMATSSRPPMVKAPAASAPLSFQIAIRGRTPAQAPISSSRNYADGLTVNKQQFHLGAPERPSLHITTTACAAPAVSVVSAANRRASGLLFTTPPKPCTSLSRQKRKHCSSPTLRLPSL